MLALAVSILCGTALTAAPCLTNGADVVGNPALGATVQTFVNLGINPNTTCIENGLWTNPSGFGLGTYIKGANGLGGSPDPTILAWNSSTVDGTIGGNANSLDFFWVQDGGNTLDFGNGIVGGAPSQGIVWDLGGQANKAVVFVAVDHGPLPEEVLENTAWLSNNPDAADGGWTQAVLEHVYGAGWSPDPNIVDGFVAVYTLPTNTTFRYVSVTWGGPGSIHRDGDNEIDAVGGLTEGGTGVNEVPEPATAGMLAGGGLLLGLAKIWRHRC